MIGNCLDKFSLCREIAGVGTLPDFGGWEAVRRASQKARSGHFTFLCFCERRLKKRGEWRRKPLKKREAGRTVVVAHLQQKGRIREDSQHLSTHSVISVYFWVPGCARQKGQRSEWRRFRDASPHQHSQQPRGSRQTHRHIGCHLQATSCGEREPVESSLGQRPPESAFERGME